MAIIVTTNVAPITKDLQIKVTRLCQNPNIGFSSCSTTKLPE